MEQSDRSDRRDRKKRRQDSPSRNPVTNNNTPTRRGRGRSQSPKARESRDYRNDGGRWNNQQREEDRGQRIGGQLGSSTKPADKTNSQNRGNVKDNAQHGTNRNNSTVQAGRGRDTVGHGQSKMSSEQASRGGSSSMPFIRNDKPYQYTFRDDPDFKLAQELGEVPDDATLRQVMGFAKFRTSHELKIPDNEHNHGIRTVKQAQYRQYMNRRNGFNRPLSPPHD